MAKQHAPNLDQVLKLEPPGPDDDGIDWQPLDKPEQLLAAIEE